MINIKRILCPTDLSPHSETAVRYALALARAHEAELIFFHCTPDTDGEEKLRWNFVNAWPSKWSGPTFNATANEVAVESIEIAHEGVTKA